MSETNTSDIVPDNTITETVVTKKSKRKPKVKQVAAKVNSEEPTNYAAETVTPLPIKDVLDKAEEGVTEVATVVEVNEEPSAEELIYKHSTGLTMAQKLIKFLNDGKCVALTQDNRLVAINHPFYKNGVEKLKRTFGAGITILNKVRRQK